jgi:hypothetical protein
VRKRALGLAVAIICCFALVSASGAATTKAQKVTKIDVSTRAAVIHYLRSIHVNPKGAVIQRGGLNYAGARCPGGGWTCASTKHTVVQIAKRGGKNRFRCSSSRCVVVQISGVAHGVYVSGRQLASTASKGGGGSTASCVKTGSSTTNSSGQTCAITQTGSGPNMAVVYENSVKSAGSTLSTVALTAAYTATIKQTASGSNPNTACVTQNINLNGSTTVNKGNAAVTLEAHQSVLINQDTTGSGANTAATDAVLSSGSTAICDPTSTNPLAQNQTLTSIAKGKAQIQQLEDEKYIACGDGVSGEYANLCLNIGQNQLSGYGFGSGPNTATFTQTSTQTAVASTPAGPVTQTQSNAPCGDPSVPLDCVFPGGLVGTVDQDSSGKSTASAIQNETQCEDASTGALPGCSPTQDSSGFSAGSLHQTQYGPVGVGSTRYHHRGRVLFSHGKGLGQSTQTGNSSCTGTACDSFGVVQNSTQNADNGASQQNLALSDCTTTGGCTSNQQTTVNTTTTPVSQTGKSLKSSINCDGESCPATPTVTGPATTPSPNPTFTITEGDSNATLLCSVDNGSYLPCGTGQNLACGTHTVVAEATDGVNTAIPSAPFSFDVTICFDGSIGTGSPPATLGAFTMTPFGADSQPVCTFDGTNPPVTAPASSVVDPAGTITFDEALNHDRIGSSPNCWLTWSNGYTGDIYDTALIPSSNPGQVTITLPGGTNAFYFYAETDQFSDFTVTATEAGGQTSGPVTVNGHGGATFFGFHGIDGATVTSITITDTDSFGFAVGEFGINKS